MAIKAILMQILNKIWCRIFGHDWHYIIILPDTEVIKRLCKTCDKHEDVDEQTMLKDKLGL